VAVSTGPHGSIEFVDGNTGRQTRAEFGGTIANAVFRDDGKVLLVANQQEKTLIALEAPSLRVIVHLPLSMQPQNLCFNSNGGQLFVSGKGMDGVAIVFPYLPMEVEQTILAGRDPGVMACSADPAYLFVASASGSDVCTLNIDDRKMIGIVEVGQEPSFITVTPDSKYALVLNERSGDMAVIHVASIPEKMGNPATMRGKSGAALFTMLPVGSRPVHAAIVAKPV
jgi:DNA-binding beta-propeller fold protein YncE